MMEIKRAAVIGVSGFIGRGLPEVLAAHGVETTGVSRRGAGEIAGLAAWQRADRLDLAGHQAVINLAGEPIDKRWTAANKRRFHDSRVGVTERIVEAIAKLPEGQRPAVLVNGSAVGIYGDRADEVLGERSLRGEGYLADLCAEWEAAAMQAEALGVRVVLLRTGVVLGRGGNAFERLLTVFKLGIGGRLGGGRQWMPWIHVDDLRAAIGHAVVSAAIHGPVNGSAPAPERNGDFTRKFARAVRRPAMFPVPGLALKLALGGFGGALLASQRAVPQVLQSNGFKFRYPTLEEALEGLLNAPPLGAAERG